MCLNAESAADECCSSPTVAPRSTASCTPSSSFRCHVSTCARTATAAGTVTSSAQGPSSYSAATAAAAASRLGQAFRWLVMVGSDPGSDPGAWRLEVVVSSSQEYRALVPVPQAPRACRAPRHSGQGPAGASLSAAAGRALASAALRAVAVGLPSPSSESLRLRLGPAASSTRPAAALTASTSALAVPGAARYAAWERTPASRSPHRPHACRHPGAGGGQLVCRCVPPTAAFALACSLASSSSTGSSSGREVTSIMC